MKQNKENQANLKLLIKSEKRKRLQVYNTIDYLLDLSTFMDFYSKDLIQILNNSELFASATINLNKIGSYKNRKIEVEDILYSFFLTKTNLKNILNDYNLTSKDISKYFSYSFKKSAPSSIFSYIKEMILPQTEPKFQRIEWQDKPKFSEEVHFLFKNSIINAIDRFKTPVITSEIFFITLMESNTKHAKIIKNSLSEENWYMLRYKLIKNIHSEESSLRTDVAKSQKYFAYLLKSNLSELEFSRLLDLNLLGLSVEYFRNKLFKTSLKTDLLELVKEDILYSAIFHKRNYSR